ncbi:MAG: hypothetical protein JSW09_10770 [Pseudomonadota bacterium]|nr:MAG: hypothetical protein JSW09_10770 [Pseudomonadota bacterium]
MISASALAYAQARLQARLGMQAPEEVWQPLLATGNYRAFLEQLRATALRPWVTNVSPISAHHEVERLLRAEFVRRIVEVASWLPAAYRRAVVWTHVLVDLPTIDYLLRGDDHAHAGDEARPITLPWMLESAELKAIAAADPEARANVLATTIYAPLARGDGSLSERWLAEWRARMPRLTKAPAAQLQRLLATLDGHMAAFAAAAGEEATSARAAWGLRRALEGKVRRHFRNGFLAPTAVFAFLILQALEFERVRGALVSRLLFGRESA